MQNKTIRNLWYNYKSEFIFITVLTALVVLSYWLATFIPELLFERYINPIEYICTIVVCFFGAWLVWRHHEDNTLRQSWAAVLLIWGCIDVLALGARYLLHITAIGGMPSDPLFNASVTLGNILAFLFFIYPTQVLRPGWLNWYRGMLLLLPMIVLGVVDYFVPVNLLPVIMIYPIVIFLTLCRHVRQYRQWSEDNFSTLDDIDAQWIVRYLAMLALVGLAFYFIVFWYVPNRMFTQQWMFLLIFSYTTERVLFRPDPWKQLRSTLPQEEETTDSEQPYTAYKATLEAWFEKDKPYLNPDFQLTDLRQVLPMNRTYLSQFINTEYGCTFFQWVNSLRVEEAKRMMTEQPDLTMKEVSKQCGFSYRRNFSRTFVEITGMTPSEWRNRGDHSPVPRNPSPVTRNPSPVTRNRKKTLFSCTIQKKQYLAGNG